MPQLERIEALIARNHWYAAGFISYEAAGAFDEALNTYPPSDFPLLWFGLYPEPDVIHLPNPDFGAYSLGETASSVSGKEYARAIRLIKRYIEAGDTYQVNYTIRLKIPFTGEPWQLFLAMVRAQSPGYAAWVDTGRYAICSASPELFFRLEGTRLTCKPMKGTVRRGRTQSEDRSLSEWLRQSEKNRAENLMIVDMIRNDLGRVANTGSVDVPRMFEIERHPTLWQMTSTVTAESSESIAGIMRALFPCASITGAPKVRTARIIRELESTPRGLYTGCIGFMSPGRSIQFNVAIRTAVVDRVRGQAEYGAGGGIVWDSSPQDEYKEALLKARVVREQRPDFSLLETLLWTPGEGYFLLDRHLERLTDSGEYFDFRIDQNLLQERLLQRASTFAGTPQRVRLLVSRDGAVEIQAAPLVDAPVARVKLAIARRPVDSNNIFLYHKTTHRQVYNAALDSRPGFEDVLLWNERRELTESCIANLVFELNGNLYTPPVDCGLLPGTFRAEQIGQGIIRERVLKLEDLDQCTKIYLVNSVRKWREAAIVR